LKERFEMEMRTPPHPGELIGDNLDELGVTIVEAAKRLGVSRQQLHNLISGRSAITPGMAIKLELTIGSTADTWLRMQTNYDLAKLRKRAPVKPRPLFSPAAEKHLAQKRKLQREAAKAAKPLNKRRA
jgi:addiction module HigA family antidote